MTGDGRSSPRALPMAPNRDVIKSQFVPPKVQHRLIESQYSIPRNAGWRRCELTQPIVDKDSLLVVNTWQEMPQREGIVVASLAQYDRDIVRALLRSAVLKIEPRQSRAELCGGILEVRRAGADLRPCRTSGSRWDKRFVAIQLESDPSQRCANHACARIVDIQSVGAAQVHRDGRWRVDHELTGRRPDVRVNRSPIQSDPLQPRTHAQQAQARAWVHLDFARIVCLKAGPRLTIGLKRLANAETARSVVRAEDFSSDARYPLYFGHVPTRKSGWRGLRSVNQECHCNDGRYGNRCCSQSGK